MALKSCNVIFDSVVDADVVDLETRTFEHHSDEIFTDVVDVAFHSTDDHSTHGPVGTMVIGTVKGDIHDIGKNLVAMMLEGAGFEVHDIGINNAVEDYIAALERHKPDILGMSALLTTTMPYMKVVIDALKEQGI